MRSWIDIGWSLEHLLAGMNVHFDELRVDQEEFGISCMLWFMEWRINVWIVCQNNQKSFSVGPLTSRYETML